MSLPPPPSREKDITGPAWQKWFSLIKEAVSPISEGGKQAWDQISKAGSRLTDIERRSHSDLQNLNSDTASHLTLVQLNELTGGLETNFHIHDHSLLTNLNSANYTHLTAVNHTDLTDAGDSILHYHASDRDSANFTGTNWTDLTDAGDSILHYHATDRALGNATGTLVIGNGGTGQTTAVAAFDALAPTTTQGDIIYYNGTDNVRLAKGTASQVLTINAGATAPEWQTPAAGGASAVSNVISTPTTIATDTSYIVASYLKIDSDLTINGNLLITG